MSFLPSLLRWVNAVPFLVVDLRSSCNVVMARDSSTVDLEYLSPLFASLSMGRPFSLRLDRLSSMSCAQVVSSLKVRGLIPWRM